MAPVDDPKDAEVEEPQIVKDLKEVDDKYLEVERKYEKERNALITKYTEMQKPLLEERAKMLAGDGTAEGPATGTPACASFWLKALQNHPAMEGEIEDYDEPVLEYLKDIQVSMLDTEDRNKGFRLKFIFAENPYFENAVLSKEYHTEEASPYTGDTDVTEVVGCTINWKPGKDVTVEKVTKKAKGGGAKKTKAKEKEETRSSFFRSFFRSLKKDGKLPEDIDPHEIAMAYGGDADDMDEDDMVGMVLENDHEVGCAIKDNIIPFAVRWYTGEAAPEQDDDDEGEEEEDDDKDENEEDDEDDDEEDIPKPAAKGKKGKKPAGEADGAKKEECKQQ